MTGNGCQDCAKMPEGKLCDYCELGMLEATMEAAISDYKAKVYEMTKKENKNAKHK